MKSMEKTILFAGKEIPVGNDLASGATFHGRKVLATSDIIEGENSAASSGAVPIVWNRGSSLSCRSLVLSCENEGGVDEVVIVFDESVFASKFGQNVENERILCELIGSYQYLTQELMSRFTKKAESDSSFKQKKIVFLYKSNPSLVDCLTSNSVKNSGVNFSSPLVACAAAGFKAYAENFAATIVDSKIAMPLLVSCESSNDLAGRDSSLAVWLCEYMDAIDNLKKPLSAKQKVSWIKAGAKNPTGFGLFG